MKRFECMEPFKYYVFNKRLFVRSEAGFLNITSKSYCYFLFLSTVLRASWMRKQSLAIFHLSPSAVIMNVCWNCFWGLPCSRNMPETITNSVFWFSVASSLTGCASSVAIECSVDGNSRKYFWMLSLPVVPLPFQTAMPLSKYRRFISCKMSWKFNERCRDWEEEVGADYSRDASCRWCRSTIWWTLRRYVPIPQLSVWIPAKTERND